MSAWNLADVKAATGARPNDEWLPSGYPSICTDTRKIQPGALFVPLVGERFDGHNFAEQALEAGAGAVLWARPEIPAALEKAPLLRVGDTLDAYQALGAYHLRRLGIPALAVTGSVGKTTTKDLLRTLLGHKLRVHATPVNHNNDVGAANTLLELTPEHQAVIVEMGMRGRDQVRRLARMVRPRVGVITTIGESHLELLGTREAIAEAKGELFEEMDAASLSVYPADSPYAHILRQRVQGRAGSFSLKSDAGSWRLLAYQPELGESGLGSRVRVAGPGGEYEFFYSRPGLHNVSNMLAALAACAEFGLTPDDLRHELASFQPTGLRAEIKRLARDIILVDDAYNAAPSSVRGGLDVVAQLAQLHRDSSPRRVAVLGDMLELGEGSADFHRQVGRACSEAGIGLLIAVGELSAQYMAPEAQAAGIEVLKAADSREAWTLLQQNLRDNDIVLVKASHSLGLEFIGEKMAEFLGAMSKG